MAGGSGGSPSPFSKKGDSMDRTEYLKIIRALISQQTGFQNNSYFEGHLPRFIAQLDMFDEHLAQEEIKVVYDLGTNIPFTSLYFNLTQNADVFCGSVDVQKSEFIYNGVSRGYVNLNRPMMLPKADLVICTECLEHLPSNLYRVRQALSEYVKNGKYMLLSFPLNGMNAKDYHLELPQDREIGHAHLREFTEQTARDFYTVSGFTLVSEKITWTDAYGGKIMNVLLKKDVYS